MLKAKAKSREDLNAKDNGRIERELHTWKTKKDKLLQLRLNDEIDAVTFTTKTAEFDEQIRNLSLRLDVQGKSQAEYADMAVKAFELFVRR